MGRALIKKGKCLKIGDKEIDYNSEFQLILHTKLANPHYKPEMQAQTTLINFTVTRDGYKLYSYIFIMFYFNSIL